MFFLHTIYKLVRPFEAKVDGEVTYLPMLKQHI